MTSPVGLRIACSGLVADEAGSVSSAGFQILHELLARGYEIDFYSLPSYVYPERLLAHSHFRYIDCSHARIDHVAQRPENEYARWLGGRIAHHAFARRVIRRLGGIHRDRQYDLLLFLGQWMFGSVPGLPVVSWVQGPPGTDARSVVRHRRSIKRLCGLRQYARLRAYSLYRASLGQPPFRHTDVTICGSHWSERMLVSRYGVPGGSTRRLPYPVDLEMFRPASSVRRERPLEVAWVGRIVPRKRLDLFLDAGAELIARNRDIRLTVVGGFPFAKGFERLLQAFPHPDRLIYLSSLPRDQVRTLLQTAAVLVQPSEEENFGSSVAEALACGTPVVVGPTNGTGDYIDAGGTRFADYRADAVAEAVSEILDRLEADPEKTRARARSAATAHFSVGHVVDSLEAVLHDAMHSESLIRRTTSVGCDPPQRTR